MELHIKSFQERETDKLELTYYENDGRVEHEELESFEKRFEALKLEDSYRMGGRARRSLAKFQPAQLS
jgi:hypothetical protein